MARASIVYPYVNATEPLHGGIPQALDLIITAYITEVRQYPAFVVFGSQHATSFVQVRLGMTVESDGTAAGQERIGKSEPNPARAPRNHNTVHLLPQLSGPHSCPRLFTASHVSGRISLRHIVLPRYSRSK